jgi:hypothetical protein
VPAIDLQGQLFRPAARDAHEGAADPVVELDHVLPIEACQPGLRRHRRRADDIVEVYLHGAVVTSGVVLNEGFDVHGRHVGWVGVPGETLVWRELCTMQPGDEAAVQRARAVAKERGVIVQVRV